MADGTIRTDVFKFVAIRPPQAKEEGESAPIGRIRDSRRPTDTPVGGLILGASADASISDLVDRVEWLIDQRGWSPSIGGAEALKGLGETAGFLSNSTESYSAGPFASGVKAILGSTPKQLHESGKLGQMTDLAWDRLEAFYIRNRSTPTNLEGPMAEIRTLSALRLAAQGEIESGEDIADVLAGTVVLDETFTSVNAPERGKTNREESKESRAETKKAHFASLWSRYVELNEAARELETFELELGEVEEEVGEACANPDDPDARARPVTARRTAVPVRSMKRSISAAARTFVEAEEPKGVSFPSVAALDRVHRELESVSAELLSADDPIVAEMMPVEARSLPAGEYLFDFHHTEWPLDEWNADGFLFPWLPAHPKVKPLGVGDLKVVKQTLQRYSDGEVAHIENVLKGESKERTHRRLDRIEDIFTVAEESTEETERDTQTTDRFELKKEAEKTIETELKVDAGVKVSASYGPVKLGAHANFAYGQSESTSVKNSSNFAREVVDKSVTRIQKKVREERVTKNIREVEEINKHGLDNVGGAGHISGIYRWVDKEYLAQVYNYGRRMMFEFIVPEPAAFYIYAQDNNPADAIDIPKPKPLGNLTHKDLTDWNYKNFVRDYQVQGVEPPPPPVKLIALSFDQSGMTEHQTSSKSSRDLVVPAGYVSGNHTWHASYWYNNDDRFFQVLIGAGDLGYGRDSVVPVAVTTHSISGYSANIEFVCHRTARHYEEWQLDTFEKITTAYKAAVAEWEDKIKAAEAVQGITIEGHNPRINRQIESYELKKHCLTLLTGEQYDNFDAMSGLPPKIDPAEAADEGAFIQFFEQAFEWEQMTYLFYPYFWGRKANWVQRSTTYDNDPQFTNFLQAGAARVVIPVHPAYNDAILYYVQTGAIWNGGEAPQLDDPLFIALHEELKAQTDDLANAVPEGEPWEVVLPTTLVHLQETSDLPDFTV